MSEENKKLMRRFFEAMSNHELEAMGECCTADYRHHNTGFPTELPPGPEGLKIFMGTYLAAFPDLHYTIEDMVAEGDKVVTRWIALGTNTGPLFGNLPPTGKPIRVEGVTIERIADGKIAETRGAFDNMGLMQQLGFIPPM